MTVLYRPARGANSDILSDSLRSFLPLTPRSYARIGKHPVVVMADIDIQMWLEYRIQERLRLCVDLPWCHVKVGLLPIVIWLSCAPSIELLERGKDGKVIRHGGFEMLRDSAIIASREEFGHTGRKSQYEDQ